MAATSNQRRELTNQVVELTTDELEHVSGAKGGKGDPKGQEYLVVTLKEVMISSV